MLISGSQFRRHRFWFGVFLIGTLASATWYGAASYGAPRWPGGSSPAGFTFGVIGGLIILFEMLIWPRKKFRHGRIGPLRFGPVRAWMRAHIWLGLLCLPLAVMHSGFQLGGPLPTVLMLVLFVVIASGVWGLYLQNRLPKLMFDEVPGETITAQIPTVMARHARDARLLVERTCGIEGVAHRRDTREDGDVRFGEALTVEAVGSVGKVQGKVLVTFAGTADLDLQGTQPLYSFFEEHAEAYILLGESSGSPLKSPTQAGRIFGDLRSLLPEPALPVLEVLRSKCDLRRQLDQQVRINFWLHNWLLVHLPLSLALTVLLVVHIWSALRYW